MVATVGSIAVAFSADLQRYEAALRKGEKRTNDFERNANKATTGVGQAFMRMGGLAKAGLAGLAAGVVAGGVTGIVGQFGQIARSIADVGDQAKLAGLSVKTFTEWRHVASQARVGVDAMADAFKELAIRADEFATTGKGSAAEAFGRIGLSREEVKERLKDPSELMMLIIERTRQLGDTAAGIRVFDEIMGGQGGEQFVRLIEDGEAGIRRTIQEAHDLNAVMSDDMVKSAAELDRRFNALATAVGTNLKSAIVSAADSLVDFINKFRDFEAQKDYQLEGALSDMGKQRLEIERQMIDIREMQRNMVPDASGGYTWAAEIGRWQGELDKIAADEERIIGILNTRKERMEKPTDRTWKPIDTGSGGGGSKRDKAAAAADREAAAVARLIGELEEELRLIGATDLERDIANELRRAGAAATADQRAKIIALVSALHAEAEASDRAADAAAALRDIGRDVLGGIVSDLREGKDAADILANALDRVADRLLDMALDGLFSGPGKGGGVFGGLLNLFGFKDGGYTGHGAKDEPAGVVHRGEVVFSKADVRRHGGVAAVEAMRKSSTRISSLPGFEKGGTVGTYVAEIAESQFAGVSSAAHGFAERVASSSANLKERDVSADVRVFVDQDGNWQAAVERIAEGPAARAASGVARAVPSIALGAMEQNRSRRTRVISPRGG